MTHHTMQEGPSEWRFGWKRAVCRSTDLPPRAKVVAGALAEHGNDATGLINPSVATLADACGMCKDTIRSAIKDLISAGWLVQFKGHGRGNASSFRLISPGNVVAFTPKQAAEKVETCRPKRSERGDLSDEGKGRKSPAKRSNFFVHIQKHEQLEQPARPSPEQRNVIGDTVRHITKERAMANNRAQRADDELPTDKRPTDLERHSGEEQGTGATARPHPHASVIVPAGSDALWKWSIWIGLRGLPKLARLTALRAGDGYAMPFRYPPDDGTAEERIALDVIEWAAKGGKDAAAA